MEIFPVGGVAGGPPGREKIIGDCFNKKRRRRINEGRRKRGEEELVGRVVDGGIKIKRNKRGEGEIERGKREFIEEGGGL